MYWKKEGQFWRSRKCDFFFNAFCIHFIQKNRIEEFIILTQKEKVLSKYNRCPSGPGCCSQSVIKKKNQQRPNTFNSTVKLIALRYQSFTTCYPFYSRQVLEKCSFESQVLTFLLFYFWLLRIYRK